MDTGIGPVSITSVAGQRNQVTVRGNQVLSTLLEKQQAILERVQEQQSRVPEIPVPLVDRIQELQREAFDILPGTVNAKRGAAAAHASEISQDIPVIGRTQFKDELAEEAIWNVHRHPRQVHFASDPQGRFTSTPLRHLEENRSKARISPEVYPPRYGMKVAVQEFWKLHKPRSINSRVDIQPLPT